jgi:hypothetical protein
VPERGDLWPPRISAPLYDRHSPTLSLG